MDLPYRAASALASAAPFVGRSTELDQLLDAWKTASVGTRTVAVVGGEPGVGKTRLLAELARTAAADGALVLWGSCDEDPVVPYQPFVEQLRAWMSAYPTLTIPLELERLLPDTARTPVSPELGAAGAGDTDRLRLFEAAARFFRDRAREAPLLLVVDDLHWAATPTVLLLRRVLSALVGDRAMVVGAFRDTELDRSSPFAALLADLHREDSFLRIALSGIDGASVTEYLGHVIDRTLQGADIELAQVIHADTNGNPFFVGQVLRHLVETGALERRSDWSAIDSLASLGLPEGIREVVGRRLAGLSASANDVLRVAAVIGPEFALPTLTAVPDAGKGPDQILDALDECLAARLIDETPARPDRYAFVHALVRQTVLADLSGVRRARLHRRIGDALADRDTEPGVLAHHYCAGVATGCATEALTASVGAADAALRSYALEEVLTIVERAVEAATASDATHAADLARLHLLAANTWLLLGETAKMRDAARRSGAHARAAGDVRAIGLAAMARAALPIAGEPDPVAQELFDEALSGLGDDDPGLRARVLAVYAFYRATSDGEGVRVTPLLEEGLDLARQSGDRAGIIQCLVGWGGLLTAHHDLDLQRRLIAELRTEAAAQADENEAWLDDHIIERMAANVCLQAGDLDGFRAAVDRCAEVEQQHNRRTGFDPMWRGALALMEGRIGDAEAHNTALADHTHDPNFANSWAAQLFTLRRQQGRVSELLPVIEGLIAGMPKFVALKALLAIACLDCDEPERAGAILRELAPDDFAAIPPDMTSASALGYLAEVCAALPEPGVAHSLHALLLPFSGQLLVVAWGVSTLGAADRYLGMLETVMGDHASASARFEAALALEETAGATELAAQTRTWRARLLG